MNYDEAMQYLEEVSHAGSKLGLESIMELLNRLGHPEDKLQFVHVAGTNGKGSTSAFLASILAEAGYKVGRYISPVVMTYEECIQVTKKNTEATTQFIKKEQVAKHITQIKEVCGKMAEEGLATPTRFEIETAMAFLEFVEQNTDLVILEVGLGGRLDATNVISNVACSILTSISMDHMQFLGNTLGEIAYEKAGIIKYGVPVVSYDQQEEARNVIEQICREKGSRLYMLRNQDVQIKTMDMEGTTFCCESEEPYYIPLLGEHQVYNAYVAINAAHVLKQAGYMITEEQVRVGLANTKWFGRFSLIETSPYVIVDGAHNRDAAKMLKESLKTYFPDKKGIFIIGVFADKEYDEILRLTLPYAKTVFTVTTNTERALKSDSLKLAASRYCDEVVDAGTIEHALTLAKSMAKKDDYILCFGSLSFLGDVCRYIG